MKMLHYSFLYLALVLMADFVSAQSATVTGSVSVSYTWTRIQSHGSNQIAVWVEDTLGHHITTLYATKFTASGGYVRRPVSLSVWAEKFGLATASQEEVDAITGSTHASGKQTLVWNCRDRAGNPVSSGTYILRMEANIKDTSKIFFAGKIGIGENAQQTSGEIVYEGPGLPTGETLFKDVLVEYIP
jgi:hypothetical protein